MFKMERQVTYSQVGSDLKTNMAVLVDYLQDCIVMHSEEIGRGITETESMQVAWFLSGWQIDVERYPELGETIRIYTWSHGAKGMYGYRNFEILDEQEKQIVKANSIWICMDLKSMRPQRPTKELIEAYPKGEPLEMNYAPRKINVMESDCRKEINVQEGIVVVKKSFLDSNQHVNNGRYVAEALDYFPDVSLLKEMRVDYRKAAVLGDCMYPAVFEKEGKTQVVFSDKDGNPFVIVEGIW